MNPGPSPTFIRFFEWFCPPELQEFILGDLEEQFFEDQEQYGHQKANRRFVWNVIRFARPGIILRRKLNTQNKIHTAMIKNYLKIGYRNLMRYKFFSFFNIAGLSIGICMSLFIITHILNELSYEKSFPKYQSIYRVASTDWAKLPPKLAPQLKAEMPEIAEIGRLYFLYTKVAVYNETETLIENPFYADQAILDIFDFEFVEGSAAGALDAHDKIVITESMAARVFKPGEQRIGARISLYSEDFLTVTGVIKDLPSNSHLKIDCLASMEDTWVAQNESDRWSGVSIYALIDSPEAAQQVNDKMLDFQIRFQANLQSEEDIRTGEDFYEAHPITDIHLTSSREKETEPPSDMAFIYIFSTLAVFILVVVIINFVNLYISQTLNRLKEIGIRKVMGAQKSQLIGQFLTESFILVIVSALLAIGLSILALPYYNQLTDIQLSIGELFSPSSLLLIGVITVMVGFIAGGYPAWYLSRFGIEEGLRTRQLKVGKKLSLRSVMVACQFLISVCLFTATLIVSKQMDFIFNKDVGFAEEEIVSVRLHGELWNQTVSNYDKVRNELIKHADIVNMSVTSKVPGERFGIEALQMGDDPDVIIGSRYMRADEHFLATMGLEVLEGDSVPRKSTGIQYIVNQSAATNLQQENLIGKTVTNNPGSEGKVIAIVNDFNFASLHIGVEPLTIQMPSEKRYFADYILFRIATQDVRATLEKIENTLHEFAPGALIVSKFVDNNMDELYEAESSMFASFKIFSTTIILLACFGLFALFAFVAQTRKKELGIRKTLGASVSQLLLTMTKSYLGILLVAMIVAIPITWTFASEWMTNFAYQVDISWWYFVIPGFFVLILAAVGMVGQSWNVAKSNPVDSLRDE